MEQIIFERLCIIDSRYKTMGIERLRDMIDCGKALVDQYGVDDLKNKLKTLEEFKAAGAYFDYHVATNEEIYESKRK